MSDTTLPPRPIKPFSTGSECRAWTTANCDACTKGITVTGGPNDWPTCEIEEALYIAYVGDGCITPEIAERMAYYKSGQCGELEAVAS